MLMVSLYQNLQEKANFPDFEFRYFARKSRPPHALIWQGKNRTFFERSVLPKQRNADSVVYTARSGHGLSRENRT